MLPTGISELGTGNKVLGIAALAGGCAVARAVGCGKASFCVITGCTTGCCAGSGIKLGKPGLGFSGGGTGIGIGAASRWLAWNCGVGDRSGKTGLGTGRSVYALGAG